MQNVMAQFDTLIPGIVDNLVNFLAIIVPFAIKIFAIWMLVNMAVNLFLWISGKPKGSGWHYDAENDGWYL